MLTPERRKEIEEFLRQPWKKFNGTSGDIFELEHIGSDLLAGIDALTANWNAEIEAGRLLAEHIENLHAIHAARLEELGKERDLLAQCVKDSMDGMECLTGCDSYSHEELCPVANPVEAWRQLRGEIERLKAASSNMRITLCFADSHAYHASSCATRDRLGLCDCGLAEMRERIRNVLESHSAGKPTLSLGDK